MLPVDRRRKECRAHLRQPGLALSSSTDLLPKTTESTDSTDSQQHSQYGWQYKELRGRRRPRSMRLSTGVTLVKAKTDSWLTYEDFQLLTRLASSMVVMSTNYHYNNIIKHCPFLCSIQGDPSTSWLQVQVPWSPLQQCILARCPTRQAQALPASGDPPDQTILTVQHLPVCAAPQNIQCHGTNGQLQSHLAWEWVWPCATGQVSG